jgi:7-cyano-7-deazaguanine synthase
MCAISGFIGSRVDGLYFQDILTKSVERGRDAFGYYSDVGTYRKVGKYNNEFNYSGQSLILCNHRAQPTTELVSNLIETDIQPYIKNNFVVIHNGTISNDIELIEKYNLNTISKIDSSVIVELLDLKWKSGTLEELREILLELKGSFALGIYDVNDSDSIYLCCNYKPIFIQNKEEGIYFASLEHFLDGDYINNPVKEIKPYTILKINKNKEFSELSLYTDSKQKRALVIGSSGLDSTVCVSWAIEQNLETDILHFKYKCKAEKKETEAIKNISNYYNCNLIEFPLDFFKDIIGGSPLLDDREINKSRDGESGAEFAHEWVPARNLVFMSIALSYAEAHNYDYIILGGNLEESGAYSDNEYIFQKKFNDIIPNSINLNKKIEILTPVANLMKKEIVELGLNLKTPFNLTWSCYESGNRHCGECGPCMMRKRAFLLNGTNDPVMWSDNE